MMKSKESDELSACQRISCNRLGNAISGTRCVISKDFVFGCKPEQRDSFQPALVEPTWCVYMRPKDNVDMAHYINRVTFRMSPRMPLRLQVADCAPFEITEVLASDFPIEMVVQYIDTRMTPTSYVYKPPGIINVKSHPNRSVQIGGEEHTEKMIFVNPSPTMRHSLTTPTLASLKTPRLTSFRSYTSTPQVGDIAPPTNPTKTKASKHEPKSKKAKKVT
ncbi:YEATS domain-containing protein 4 [Scaptodrosophila lebanonensis]|uniref:YEATS domain-containing protein 4 n=1 Tax=Drosophila lebanonensis TaxID=7225 RepID=A0A6J2U2M0_DROLE|nr:YEATS domain-containing protein 4 [Scaptodrosophila lebanonensis]